MRFITRYKDYKDFTEFVSDVNKAQRDGTLHEMFKGKKYKGDDE